ELPTAKEQAQIAARQKRITGLEADIKGLRERILRGEVNWEEALKKDRLTAYLLAILKTPRAERTAAQQKALAEHYASSSPERHNLEARRARERKALEGLRRWVLITRVREERPQPRDTFVLVRGQYDKYGEKVRPSLPACLPPLPKGEANNRLGLARWLVDR